MRQFLGAVLAMVFSVAPAPADDKDATAIVDKAIGALGGAEKLGKVKRLLLEIEGHGELRRQRERVQQ